VKDIVKDLMMQNINNTQQINKQNNMTADIVCTVAGWILLLASWLWRNTTDKDKELTIKLMLSALSAGVFLANIIHFFLA